MTWDNRTPGDLGGIRVLIVEDEFYLAADLKESLELAGATVLGPCANAEAASRELGRTVPDCAVVDINLGSGPAFDTAEILQERGVPFVFLAGYDKPSIPQQYAQVERFEKPAELNRVLRALRRISAR